MRRSHGNTKMTPSHRFLLISIIAGAAVFLVSCGRERGVEASPEVDNVPTVAVAKVIRTDLSTDLVLTAEFEPFQDVDVMAKVSGYIQQIKVDIGDRVREGQLLAVLEIPEMQDDLVRAAASIDEANAELATARDDLQRAESAHDIAHLSYSRILNVSKREPGLVPQEEVDEARSRDLVAEAQMAAAKSHITACEQRTRVSQAEESRLKTLYRYAVITAPFSGVVTKRYANTGTLIQAGTSSQTQAMPVVRLAENGLLRLALPVPESAVPLVHLGEPVEVKVPALNRTFPGKVALFADEVDQSTRTMKTEVDVPNQNFTLVPGMYAEVDLKTDQEQNVLAVPAQAIDGDGTSARIYLVRYSGRIHIVPVRLGVEGPRLVEVQSTELQEEDRVVVGSRSGLKDGERVDPKIVSLAGDSTPKP
jgi:RND family efflux transporter MFP subunit